MVIGNDADEAARAFRISTMAQALAVHYGVEAILVATRQLDLCVDGSPMAATWAEIVSALRLQAGRRTI